MPGESFSRPIFVLGCPRSGTTLLRLMLDAHPHLSCGPETSFLLDLKSIVTRHWPHIELYGFPKTYWHREIACFFASFQQAYAEKRGKIRWADKTPHYTPHADFLRLLFPEAQFVHLIRDGRDVTASHRSRWGYRAALRGIRNWCSYVSAARAFGRGVPADQYSELRYEDLVVRPEQTLRGLLAFLDEPWDAGVLNHLQAQHDLRPNYAVYTGRRRQQGADAEPVYASRVGVWHRELDPFLHLMFYAQAGRLLRELGYT